MSRDCHTVHCTVSVGSTNMSRDCHTLHYTNQSVKIKVSMDGATTQLLKNTKLGFLVHVFSLAFGGAVTV